MNMRRLSHRRGERLLPLPVLWERAGERVLRCGAHEKALSPTLSRSTRRGSERSRGFTLIEMMAVVIIMALLATAAALSFARPMRVARARDAVDQIQSLDASARQFARRFGKPVEIVFDLSNGTLARRDRDTIAFQSSLPRGCRIDEVRVAGQSFSLGEASIQCAASGMSRS